MSGRFDSVCLVSFLLQMVVIDDVSTDQTLEVARTSARNDSRIRIDSSLKTRSGALYNTVLAIDLSDAGPEDVILVLDGDDWLSGPHVLSHLAHEYVERSCLLTYGTFIEYPTGLSPDWEIDFPPEVINHKAFRQYPFTSSHLRTFKHKLFRHIERFFSVLGHQAYLIFHGIGRSEIERAD